MGYMLFYAMTLDYIRHFAWYLVSNMISSNVLQKVVCFSDWSEITFQSYRKFEYLKFFENTNLEIWKKCHVSNTFA